MSFRATTTVTVLRGMAVDSYGDPYETDTAVYERVPMSIMEQGASSRSRPVDGRTDQVRAYTGRCGTRWTIQRDDRIRDERDGTVYTVDMVTTPRNVAGGASRNLTLRRVS